MTIRLVIIGKVTPSQNVRDRRHFGARKRDRAEWAAELLYAMRKQNLTPADCKATGRRRLTIERYENGQGLDYGNLVGGMKDLIDEIVRHGLLIDDSPKYCEEVAKQWKPASGARKHLIITLEDL